MAMTFAEITAMVDKDDELFAERIRQHFIDVVNESNERDLAEGMVFTLGELAEAADDETATIDVFSQEYYDRNRESIFAVYEAAMAMFGERIYKELVNCENEEDVDKINLNEVLEDFFKDLIMMAAIKNGNEEEGS